MQFQIIRVVFVEKGSQPFLAAAFFMTVVLNISSTASFLEDGDFSATNQMGGCGDLKVPKESLIPSSSECNHHH